MGGIALWGFVRHSVVCMVCNPGAIKSMEGHGSLPYVSGPLAVMIVGLEGPHGNYGQESLKGCTRSAQELEGDEYKSIV